MARHRRPVRADQAQVRLSERLPTRPDSRPAAITRELSHERAADTAVAGRAAGGAFGTGVALPYRQAPRRVLVCHGTVTQAPLTVLRVATKTI